MLGGLPLHTPLLPPLRPSLTHICRAVKNGRLPGGRRIYASTRPRFPGSLPRPTGRLEELGNWREVGMERKTGDSLGTSADSQTLERHCGARATAIAKMFALVRLTCWEGPSAPRSLGLVSWPMRSETFVRAARFKMRSFLILFSKYQLTCFFCCHLIT